MPPQPALEQYLHAVQRYCRAMLVADVAVNAQVHRVEGDPAQLFDRFWQTETRRRLLVLREATIALSMLPGPVPPPDLELRPLLRAMTTAYFAYTDELLRMLHVLAREGRAGHAGAVERLGRAASQKVAGHKLEQTVAVALRRLEALVRDQPAGDDGG